jgi:hypothetical protein
MWRGVSVIPTTEDSTEKSHPTHESYCVSHNLVTVEKADTQVRDNIVVVRRSAGFSVQERGVWIQEM